MNEFKDAVELYEWIIKNEFSELDGLSLIATLPRPYCEQFRKAYSLRFNTKTKEDVKLDQIWENHSPKIMNLYGVVDAIDYKIRGGKDSKVVNFHENLQDIRQKAYNEIDNLMAAYQIDAMHEINKMFADVMNKGEE